MESASAKVRRNIKTFWRNYIKLEGKKKTLHQTAKVKYEMRDAAV